MRFWTQLVWWPTWCTILTSQHQYIMLLFLYACFVWILQSSLVMLDLGRCNINLESPKSVASMTLLQWCKHLQWRNTVIWFIINRAIAVENQLNFSKINDALKTIVYNIRWKDFNGLAKHTVWSDDVMTCNHLRCYFDLQYESKGMLFLCYLYLMIPPTAIDTSIDSTVHHLLSMIQASLEA